MPGPVSPSTITPKGSEALCGFGDDPSSQTCHDPASALPTLAAPVVNSSAAPVTLAEPVGAGVNLANGEVTLDYKGWSFSLGLGLSLGASIASGEGRDLDSDGVPERCFEMSLGPLTLGECDEL